MNAEESFDEYNYFVVELPVREQGRAEVLEAKQKEIESLQFNKTYDEIENIEQESITIRWVPTIKLQ